MTNGIEIRAATPEDDANVLDLLAASLGWVPNDLHAEFFDWKHRRNPFGASPAWVAVDGDRVAGYRTFLRWEFEDGTGRTYRAVRAVDTATHPDYRGRGIFTRLTRHALEAVGAEGVDFVFNTPNDQSRPGYLKMGWEVVGRLPVAARLRSPRSAWRTLRARVPADKWSQPTSAGVPARALLGQNGADDGLAALLADRPPAQGLRTRLTPEVLRWRYGFEPLQYRVALAGDGIEDGAAFVRLRRRGPALEATLCGTLGLSRRSRAPVRFLREAEADYLVGLTVAGRRRGFVPLPRQGPVLTWREVTTSTCPPIEEWKLSLGDIELF